MADPRSDLGRLWPSYTVKCAGCQEELLTGERQKAKAEARIRAFGWRLAYPEGWLCPVCAASRLRNIEREAALNEDFRDAEKGLRW